MKSSINGVRVSAAVVAAVVGAATAAPPVFTPLGQAGTQATGISADGTVIVGVGTGGVQRWTGGTWTVIGGSTSSTPSISRDGTSIAGTALEVGTNYQTAALWLGGTNWQTLGGLGGVSSNSQGGAFGISGDGTVVVGLAWIGASVGSGRAFSWSQGTGMLNLGTINGSSTRANGVSADGNTIVGWEQIATRVPAVWVGGVETILDPVGVGEVWAANDDGSRVVGWTTPNAMVWNWNGSAWASQSVGFFPGSESGRAFAISDDGAVVAGQCNLPSPFPPAPVSAFYWTAATGAVELKPYLESLGTTGLTNWTLNRVVAMSSDGRTLLGVGKFGASFASESFIVTFPESCYPDCNADAAMTIADFGCFQTKFVTGDPYADCTGDTALTIADFGCFQTKFVAGCP